MYFRYSVELAELKGIRKRRFGMTKDALAASPLIVGFLGNGDAEVAHSVFIQSALRHEWQQEIEAALYSLGVACDEESHLDRLEAFATEWFMDQRQARRYSDKGLEQIATLITTNWAVFSTPTIQLTYTYMPALAQMRIDVVAYNGIQDRANQTKIDSDISKLNNAILAARINTNSTLGQIVGQWWTAAACVSKLPAGDIADLPKSDPCWVDYITALNKIGAASGAQLAGLVDPWGRPYVIDANEAEPSYPSPCNKDALGIFTKTDASTRLRVELYHGAGC